MNKQFYDCYEPEQLKSKILNIFTIPVKFIQHHLVFTSCIPFLKIINSQKYIKVHGKQAIGMYVTNYI